jgi:hypothetical protein
MADPVSAVKRVFSLKGLAIAGAVTTAACLVAAPAGTLVAAAAGAQGVVGTTTAVTGAAYSQGAPVIASTLQGWFGTAAATAASTAPISAATPFVVPPVAPIEPVGFIR